MSFDSITLECFLAVAESSSFTAASNKVARTQSAVSQQISKLESKIGKPLFNRGKNFTLTSEGKVLLNYAKNIVRLDREMMELFKQPELQGKVCFGMPESFADSFLSNILVKYTRLHPLVFLKVECYFSLDIIAKFQNNEFDLALVKSEVSKRFSNATSAWEETLEWVGNYDFFSLTNRKYIPLVLSPDPCIYREQVIKALERYKIKYQVIFSSSSYAGTIAAVKAGMGITALPRSIVPNDLMIIRNNKFFPKLKNIKLSLLKNNYENDIINSLESFVIKVMNNDLWKGFSRSSA